MFRQYEGGANGNKDNDDDDNVDRLVVVVVVVVATGPATRLIAERNPFVIDKRAKSNKLTLATWLFDTTMLRIYHQMLVMDNRNTGVEIS
jgi:hypothetical protein